MRIVHFIAAGLLAALSALPAAAAQTKDENDTSLIIVTLGGGGQLRPAFPGARDQELRPWPLFAVRKVGTDPAFSTPDQSFGFAVVKGKGLRAGPAARLGESRDEEDFGSGIGDVKRSVEIGGFAEYYAASNIRVRGELRKGLGGHGGLIADLGGDVIAGKATDSVQVSVGPRLRLADKRYVRAFFGVDAEQSERTGLAVYSAGGGLHSLGGLGSVIYRMKGGFGLEGFARFDRLVGDAADSPVVRSSAGSRNQFELGLGLTYSFGL